MWFLPAAHKDCSFPIHHTHTHVRAHARTHAHERAHTHTHTHTHTRTHARTHTSTPSDAPPLSPWKKSDRSQCIKEHARLMKGSLLLVWSYNHNILSKCSTQHVWSFSKSHFKRRSLPVDVVTINQHRPCQCSPWLETPRTVGAPLFGSRVFFFSFFFFFFLSVFNCWIHSTTRWATVRFILTDLQRIGVVRERCSL